MLSCLGERRVLLVQSSQLPCALLDFKQRSLNRRDGHHLYVDDLRAAEDCWEVLLGGEVCLLDPYLLRAVTSRLGYWARVAEEVDRATLTLETQKDSWKRQQCFIPVLVVRANLGRDIWVRKDRKFATGLGRDGGTLNVLVCTESNVDRRIAHGFKKLSARVLVEHAFAEGTKLLPLVTAVLDTSCQEAQWQDAD